MSVMENRGGWPHVIRSSCTTAGRELPIPFVTKFIQIRASAFPAKVYFTQENFDTDADYIEVPIAAAANPHGWSGPAEIQSIWIKGDGGTSNIELVAYQRRG